MDDRALAYLISLGILGAGFGWIAVAHSALIVAVAVGLALSSAAEVPRANTSCCAVRSKD
jgi:hypothetical protein